MAVLLWPACGISADDARPHELPVTDVAPPLLDPGGVSAAIPDRRHAVRDKLPGGGFIETFEVHAVVEESWNRELAVAVDGELRRRQRRAGRLNRGYLAVADDDVAVRQPRPRGHVQDGDIADHDLSDFEVRCGRAGAGEGQRQQHDGRVFS